MKRFVFRLEKLRGVRIAEQRLREVELLEATAVVRGIEQEIVVILHGLSIERIGEGAIVSVDLLVQESAYRERLKTELEAAKQRLSQAQVQEQEAMERYVAARKEVKALDRLKERKREEYLEYRQREEQAEIDDVAARQLLRKRTETEKVSLGK